MILPVKGTIKRFGKCTKTPGKFWFKIDLPPAPDGQIHDLTIFTTKEIKSVGKWEGNVSIFVQMANEVV